MLHAYCVRRAGEPAPPAALRGLDDAPVRLIEAGDIGLWVSDARPLRPTAERLARHDAVVREALRSATPLPIRYGAGAFPSEAAALEALAERGETLRAALYRVAGRLEMGVRVEWTDGPGAPEASRPAPGSAAAHASAGGAAWDRPPDPAGSPEPPGGGRAYLEARRRALEDHRAERVAAGEALDRVERALGLGDAPAVRTVLPAPGTIGLLAHLVDRSDVPRYRACVEAAGEMLPEYRLTASGPWAPYSFA